MPLLLGVQLPALSVFTFISHMMMTAFPFLLAVVSIYLLVLNCVLYRRFLGGVLMLEIRNIVQVLARSIIIRHSLALRGGGEFLWLL